MERLESKVGMHNCQAAGILMPAKALLVDWMGLRSERMRAQGRQTLGIWTAETPVPLRMVRRLE